MSILDSMRETELEPVSVHCTDEQLVVTLKNGQSISNALIKYPRLLHASVEERAQVELSPFGIHWTAIDEDLSIRGLLKGSSAPNAVLPHMGNQSEQRIR